MKIELENFGPIKNFKFDLAKDLTVVFGKNNIGKSYAITCVYIMLKHMIGDSFTRSSFDILYFRRFYREKPNNSDIIIDKDIDKILVDSMFKLRDSQNSEVEITNVIETAFRHMVSDSITQNLERSFNNSFSSIDDLSNKYSNKGLSITMFYKDFDILIGVKDKHLVITELKLNNKIFIKKAKTNRAPLRNDQKTTLYVKSFNKENRNNYIEMILRYVIMNLFMSFRNEVSAVIDNVYFLPASRSGLYQALSTFSAVIAELSKSRNFLTNSIELPNISEPVSDYFLNLSNITSAKKQMKQVSKIATQIEQDILRGQVKFNQDSRRIFFCP
ncbi:AAA family ATPase [Hymenobacter sp. APR13]|uniref:AAA family ATPase n=1 Tax=Hymenobacter sp. APR13 TaxID=1356852 RepID=UPI00090060EF|nr:AAA family ATPase [Hymenobacter sp. APR13]